MENINSNEFNQPNTESNKGKLNQKISKIMDIKTFEDGVRKGLYSDDKGTAYLILNGTLFNTYNVYIDRRKITKAGSVISFESLLKSYAPEEIQIRYDIKEKRMPSLETYRSSREGNKKR